MACKNTVVYYRNKLHAESTALAVPESVVQTSSLIDLCLPFFITHEPASDTHVPLVIPDTPIILFDVSFLLVLIK